MGSYLHGLFEEPTVLQALFGASTPTLETVFEGLADYLDQHMSTEVLLGLIA
jgi:adenosylcobyric acid synthase